MEIVFEYLSSKGSNVCLFKMKKAGRQAGTAGGLPLPSGSVGPYLTTYREGEHRLRLEVQKKIEKQQQGRLQTKQLPDESVQDFKARLKAHDARSGWLGDGKLRN